MSNQFLSSRLLCDEGVYRRVITCFLIGFWLYVLSFFNLVETICSPQLTIKGINIYIVGGRFCWPCCVSCIFFTLFIFLFQTIHTLIFVIFDNNIKKLRDWNDTIFKQNMIKFVMNITVILMISITKQLLCQVILNIDYWIQKLKKLKCVHFYLLEILAFLNT